MAFLWFPFTPEKLITMVIAIALLRFLFPNDQKTLAILRKLHEKAKLAVKNRKNKTKEQKKSRKSRKLIILSALAVLIIVGGIWIAWGNKALVTTNIIVKSENIPEGFDGFKIVQISDLHDAEFGKNNKKLLERIKDLSPDIIIAILHELRIRFLFQVSFDSFFKAGKLVASSDEIGSSLMDGLQSQLYPYELLRETPA